MAWRGLGLAGGLALAGSGDVGAQAVATNGGRVAWTTSRLQGSPDPAPPYVAEAVFPALRFEGPVEMAVAPGVPRLFVMEVQGRVLSFSNRTDVLHADVCVDFRGRIPQFGQSFGMAFHPGFATNRQVFVCYTREGQAKDGTFVSRFSVSGSEPPILDVASEQVVIRWPSGGHNGGSIHFGPDGMLYLSAGDSADPSPPDPLNTGQDLSDLLSSVSRIDVDHPEAGRAYRIPADNPFRTTPGARPEIWAYGFRNPWRMSFDSATGDLWVGDVGWDLWEMIYRVQRGGNYGWSIMEGPQPVKPNNPRGPTPILPPVTVHPHTEARSITGGYVYHGRQLPELRGAYVYGDYMTGRIWALRTEGGQLTSRQELAVTPVRVVAFGQDQAGELYLLDFVGGPLKRLVRNPVTGANPGFPRRLSGTGLFSAMRDQTPAPGVLPYAVRSELWSDGAVAERWVGVPGTAQLLRIAATDWETGEEAGSWRFPTNGVLAKTLSLELQPGNPASRRRLETQVLLFDGHLWHPYVYRWNDEQTDAVLAEDQGTDRTFTLADPGAANGRRQLTWHYASPSECILCHGMSAGGQLGFTPWQLDRPAAGTSAAGDQLEQLRRMGWLAEPATRTNVPVESELAGQVRAYLEVNCSHCHRPNAGGAATINARWNVPLDKMGLLGARPSQGDFGVPEAWLVAPGHPERSILLMRMAKLGSGHMPRVGSGNPDIGMVRKLRDWIYHLDAAAPRADQALGVLRGETVSSAALTPLVASPAMALLTALALDDPAAAVPPTTRAMVLRAARQAGNSVVRDLFERFVPEAERVAKLGANVHAAELLKLPGNAEAGRKVFFDVAQCSACHQIAGRGKPIGPDLATQLPKLSRAQILESIREPSRNIAPEYVVQTVKLRDGETVSGFLRGRTASETVLLDASGREVRIPAAEVDSITPQKLSLMPEGLLQNLTAQEAADLLEFLSGWGPRP